MARQLPSLVALRAFEAAARHLSFTAAASELNVTQGAVSRHIKALELYLRVPLFRRLPRALELTPEGSAYYPALRESLDTIERATRRLLNRNHDRILTLSVLPTFAMSWIIPRLAAFNALHPSLEIHMVTSILPADFHGEIDMAIRVGTRHPEKGEHRARIDLVMTEDWNAVEAEFLMPDVITPVCRPSLLERGAPLKEPRDLARHTLLHTSTRPHAWADWLHAVGAADLDPGEGPAYGHFFMTLQAAMQGKGIACVPGILVADDIAAGRLAAPFPQRVESAGAYHLLYRKHEADSRKIRVFRDWLLSEAKPYRR
jgi:LysR family transcriptional regulator, glycine cleavage system transcriptional activator